MNEKQKTAKIMEVACDIANHANDPEYVRNAAENLCADLFCENISQGERAYICATERGLAYSMDTEYGSYTMPVNLINDRLMHTAIAAPDSSMRIEIKDTQKKTEFIDELDVEGSNQPAEKAFFEKQDQKVKDPDTTNTVFKKEDVELADLKIETGSMPDSKDAIIDPVQNSAMNDVQGLKGIQESEKVVNEEKYDEEPSVVKADISLHDDSIRETEEKPVEECYDDQDVIEAKEETLHETQLEAPKYTHETMPEEIPDEKLHEDIEVNEEKNIEDAEKKSSNEKRGFFSFMRKKVAHDEGNEEGTVQDMNEVEADTGKSNTLDTHRENRFFENAFSDESTEKDENLEPSEVKEKGWHGLSNSGEAAEAEKRTDRFKNITGRDGDSVEADGFKFKDDGGQLFKHTHKLNVVLAYNPDTVCGRYKAEFWPTWIQTKQYTKTFASCIIRIVNDKGEEALSLIDNRTTEYQYKFKNDAYTFKLFACWDAGELKTFVTLDNESQYKIDDEIEEKVPDKLDIDFLKQFKVDVKGQPAYFIVPLRDKNNGEKNIPIVGTVTDNGVKYILARVNGNTCRYTFNNRVRVITGHWENGTFKINIE